MAKKRKNDKNRGDELEALQIRMLQIQRTRPVTATFLAGIAREIVCPVIGKATGTHGDGNGSFGCRTAAAVDAGR